MQNSAGVCPVCRAPFSEGYVRQNLLLKQLLDIAGTLTCLFPAEAVSSASYPRDGEAQEDGQSDLQVWLNLKYFPA